MISLIWLRRSNSLIKNPEQAEKIAKEGWEKTRKSFNAKRITQFMVEVTFKQPLSENYEWSHEVYA